MATAEVWGKTVGPREATPPEYYPLLAHMLDTATMMKVLWKKWLRKDLRALIEEQSAPLEGLGVAMVAGGVHDLGKCTPIFQGQLLSSQSSRHEPQRLKLEEKGFPFPQELSSSRSLRENSLHRHEKLGCYSLTHQGDLPPAEASKRWLELVTVGHHGSFFVSYGTGRRNHLGELETFTGEKWQEEQAVLIARVEEAAGCSLAAVQAVGLDSVATILMAGLVVLADRVASTDRFVEEGHRQLQEGELSLEEGSSWVAAREVLAEKLVGEVVGFPPKLSKEEVMGGYSPRGVQKVVSESEGLWLVMAPTGTGKTEAALLRHSLQEERLIFLLPTQATTNAMMKRVGGVFAAKEPTTAVLGHGLAFLEDFYKLPKSLEGEEVLADCGLTPTEFTGSRGAKLSAAVNIATVDQMLMGALPVKWTHLRWLLLANSHVVIDEAHLLDHYQVELLKPLLDFLGRTRTRVTLLSATLPTWLEQEFSKSYSKAVEATGRTLFPSSVTVEANGTREVTTSIEAEKYSVEVELVETESLEATHIAWAKATLTQEPKARLGIFVNQIKRAQAIASTLAKELPDVTVLCLHSRMLAGHRKKVTEELLRLCGTKSGQAERFIIVGTQVIEMSLDIDLDRVSTDLCPGPSLIQRWGRGWRDKDALTRFERIGGALGDAMKVQVVAPVKEGELEGRAFAPYGEALGRRTLAFLRETSSLTFPQDLQAFVETVHHEGELATTAEQEEKAEELHRIMEGRRYAIEGSSLYPPFRPEVRLFSSLTEGMEEGAATRLIELTTEPLVVVSSEPWLQALGALPPEVSVEKASVREAQSASVSLSPAMGRALEKLGLVKLKLPTYSFGFWGELPKGFSYDPLVGLVG